MKIIDNILTIDTIQIELPRLPSDAKVYVWTVPVSYKTNGYFVSVTPIGQPREHPACRQKDAVFLGELEYPADESTAAQVVERAAEEELKEQLIQKKMRQLAEEMLVSEGVLTAEKKLVKSELELKT